MGGFGQFLVEHGVLNDAQLEEALRFQKVYGGRIGTVVVDLGFLVVEELAELLSDFCGVPLPPPAWLEAPDAQALKNVPPPVIRRCQALPLSLDDGDLHVVMLDPRDPEKLDFLAMASSRPVVPYVLPERKLLYWLETHCGLDRPPRFLGMITQPRQIGLTEDEVVSGTPRLDTRERIELRTADANHAADAGGSVRDGATTPTAAALPPLGATPSSTPPARADASADEEEIILLDELVAESKQPGGSWALPEELVEAAAQQAEGDHASESPSIRLARLEAKLYQGSDRDEVLGLALEIARSFSVASALFVVRGETVTLFRSGIPGCDPAKHDLSVPLYSPSVFAHPVHTGMPFRGQGSLDGPDGRILEGLGRAGVAELLIHPVVIRDRVVNLLFADNGPEAFGETSIGALTALCHTLSTAYERLIAEQKQTRSK